jgi:hypothetical protein
MTKMSLKNAKLGGVPQGKRNIGIVINEIGKGFGDLPKERIHFGRS